jgi:hypothetical protein
VRAIAAGNTELLQEAIKSVNSIAEELWRLKQADMRIFAAIKGCLELHVNGCTGQGLLADQHR